MKEKLASIVAFREEGNKRFCLKDFSAAEREYKRALVYIDYSFGETDEENDAIDTERHKIHLNLAAVYLEMKDTSQTINECRLALQVDPGSSKALYRRGRAYLVQGDLELAQADLYKALKLATTESKESRRTVELAIHDLNAKWREYKSKSGSIAKAALS